MLSFSHKHIKKKNYMYNNSRRTSTECSQKNLNLKKGKKPSAELDRTKKKREREGEKRNQDGISTTEKELLKKKGTHTPGSH